MASPGGVWGEWWTVPRLSPPVQEGGGVAVVSDHDAILADLSVTELLRQGEAEVPCPVGIGGSVLPGSRGADHVKAHLVSFRLMPLVWHRSGGNGAIGGQSPNWSGSRPGYKLSDQVSQGFLIIKIQDFCFQFFLITIFVRIH